MKQLYAGVFFLVASLPLTGMDPVVMAARFGAIRLLRALYPRTTVMAFDGLERPVVPDLLDQCASGDKKAFNSLKTLIRNTKTKSLLHVSTVKNLVLDDDAANIEHTVSGLLEPEQHPCHNLIQASGEVSEGYPFAKSWIQQGNLEKAVGAKYQSLTDALHLVSSDK